MAFTDLREFVARLEKHGRLRRVTRPSRATSRSPRSSTACPRRRGDGNVALLFERVDGFDMPVLVNAFGSEDAHGARRSASSGWTSWASAWPSCSTRGCPARSRERLRKLGTLIDVARAAPAPRRVRRPARRSSRRRRPRWPACRSCSAGPATADATSRCPPCSRAIPVTGARNVGMYRLQVFDDRTLGMHWQTHKGGAEHEHRADRPHAGGHRARRRSRHDLRGVRAAAARHRRGRLRRLAARSRRGDGALPHDRPRGAGAAPRSCWRAGSIRSERGWRARSAITPATTRWPATTRSSTSRPSPGARGRSIRRPSSGGRRRRTTGSARPPSGIFLPIMRLMLPEIVDVNMPAEGVFHNLVIVSIRKRYPGQARKVMQALWGMGLMMLAKTIVVVSEHVNVHDLSEVAWRATGNIDPRRDLVDPRGADGRSRPRGAPPSLRRQAGRGRDREGPARRRHAGLARRDPHERRGARARDAALEGIRALSTLAAPARRHQVRAHGLRAPLRLHRHGAGRRRLAGRVDASAG